MCPLALLGSALYPILVHRLAVYASRFLPTLGHPHAVALHFVRCDQLTAGLAPAGVRPCWAHTKKALPSLVGPLDNLDNYENGEKGYSSSSWGASACAWRSAWVK